MTGNASKNGHLQSNILSLSHKCGVSDAIGAKLDVHDKVL